jgi:hypothetical protein
MQNVGDSFNTRLIIVIIFIWRGTFWWFIIDLLTEEDDFVLA